VSGQRRYVITYTINDGLNPFPDHDELYWNVTGNEWPVPIETASAAVSTPASGIQRIACYQGPTGSTDPCVSSGDQSSASFRASEGLNPGSGLTLVVGLRKGLIAVGAPRLTPVNDEPLVDTSLGNLSRSLLSRLGDVADGSLFSPRSPGSGGSPGGIDGTATHITWREPAGAAEASFARETVVVEYQPPAVERAGSCGLRRSPSAGRARGHAGRERDDRGPAVRRHIVIKELPKDGIFGPSRADYELQLREGAGTDAPADGLLPYESTLKSALFDGNPSVKLSELKNKFHDDLAQVKGELYDESVKSLKLFQRDPEKYGCSTG
jgi:hypothetical protein